MKRFTKALSMLLAIVMVVGLLPLSIIAEDIQTTHTVQFNLNYNGAHKIPSQKVTDGECAVQPEDVTREGWIFEYWYVKTGDGIQKFDLSQPITEDVTLYARWNEDITYWGPIWGRNILNGIAESEKEDESVEDSEDDEENDEDISDTPVETDTDNDSIPDYIEEFIGSDPTKDDTDGDGLSDSIEVVLALDPTNPDSDNNGIMDGDEDTDVDGLTNLDESSYNTDPGDDDSDDDGLKDWDEINHYNTDPLNYDTDEDGASDGWEIANNYDPLVYNDSFIVSLDVDGDQTTASVTIPLAGKDISSLAVKPVTDNLLLDDTMPGYISSPFSFTVDGTFSEATISFTFDITLLNDKSFCPRIYYFNAETQFFEELETTIEGNIASAKVSHFSTYILLNKTEFDKVWESEIKPPNYTSDYTGLDVVFVIDSSGSMSSNDRNNLRLQAAKNFVDKLGESDRAAVVDFDSYATLYQGFTSDHDLLYTAINRINRSGGTNLSQGISMAISQFTSDAYTRGDAYKYIIFLTDGDGSYSTTYTTLAAENEIVIYTIGLGSGVRESVLKGIANGTGGKYYFASTADVLEDIYDEVAEETVDYVTDSNTDKISDYYTKLLCEGTLKLGSGKKTPFYGLSFEAIQANADYDNDGLLNGEELIIKCDANGKCVYVWMMSDPTSADSDLDGIDDINDKDTVSVDSNRFKADIKYTTGGNPYNTTADFIVDYKKFFKDNTEYYQELAELASLYALDMYDDGYLNFYTFDNGKGTIGSTVSKNGVDFGALFGMDDGINIKADQLLSKYSTKVNDKTVDNDDVSEVSFAHQRISYQGEQREIFFLTVRGTNGTQAEWSSNFDIGYDGKEYYDKVGNDHPDWNTKAHHKGFDVAANRILNAFDEYIADLIEKGKIDSTIKRCIFITGHSRGAAIANILGAHFEDDSAYDSYVYTMATPLTTTKANANSYKTIFNLVNKDDLVTYLPLDDWKFDWYGQTLEISVKDKYEDSKAFSDRSNSFEGYFGKDYNDNAYLNKTVKSFNNMVDTSGDSNSIRKRLYELDTTSGDGVVTDGSLVYFNDDHYNDFCKMLKAGQLDHLCIVEKNVDIMTWPGYNIKVTYCPAYAMQLIADLAIEEDQYKNDPQLTDYGTTVWLSIDLKGKYSTARKNFVLASGKFPVVGGIPGGMECPHMPGTYYLITSETSYQNFTKK